MATSVLTIDVGDAKFRQFIATFNQYKLDLSLMPGEWKKIAEATAASTEATHALVKVMESLPADIERAASAHSRFHAVATNSTHVMDKLTTGAKSFAGYIETAARGIAGWAFTLSGLSALGLGLGAVGSGFLLDKLGANAAGMRQQSFGLGVSPGELASFKTNLGRFVDPGFLGRVSEQQLSLSGSVPLMRASGLGYDQVRHMDPAQLASQALLNYQRMIQQDPHGPPVDESVLGRLGQDIGLSREERRRLYSDRSGELQTQVGAFRENARQFNVPDADLKRWQDFMTQLDRAKVLIETSLMGALSGLAEPLGHVSAALANLVTALGKSDTVKQWIDDFGAAIEAFAKYINKPEFRADVEQFASEVGKAATELGHLVAGLKDTVDWIAAHTGKNKTAAEIGGGLGAVLGYLGLGPLGAILGAGVGAELGSNVPTEVPKAPALSLPGFTLGPNYGGGGEATGTDQALPQGYYRAPPPPEFRQASFSPMDYSAARYIAATWMTPGGSTWGGQGGPTEAAPPEMTGNQWTGLEASGSLPGGLLNAVEMAESGGNPNATSATGAVGAFQFIRSTAERYGLIDQSGDHRKDPIASARAASRYLSDLLSEFHGDVGKAVAGYNWGEANVEKDVAEHGADWMAYAPSETQRYVRNIMGRLGGGGGSFAGRGGGGWGQQTPVIIRIENNTGGSAVVSTNQMTAGA